MMLGEAGTYVESTSDLCPVPFCTIEKEIVESEFIVAADTEVVAE